MSTEYDPPDIHYGTLKGYDDFYFKHLKAGQLHITSSRNAPDTALHEAAYLVLSVLDGREDVQQAISDAGVFLVVMSHDEFTTDVPAHADLEPAEWWNRRARGLGATKQRPVWSTGTENLLDYSGDPYKGESILIHEFAHVIHHFGIRQIDPTFDQRLLAAYEAAKKAGKWERTYLISNVDEYWAEGVQIYFESNPSFANHSHGEINLRSELKEHDPALFRVIDQVFKGNTFIYTPPRDRSNQRHLQGWDFDQAPTFVWPQAYTE